MFGRKLRLFVAAALAAIAVGAHADDVKAWAQFVSKYKKLYGTRDEESRRFAIFRDNLRAAEQMQKESATAVYGVTKFMDLTPEEFSLSHGLLRRIDLSATANAAMTSKATDGGNRLRVANETDWVARGLVSRVKEQGKCHSCWAFSSSGGLEGCIAAKTGRVVDLSPQHILDCSAAGLGCLGGGIPHKALHWGVANDIATWESYPYHNEKGDCRPQSEWAVGLRANECTFHKIAMHEAAMREGLTHSTVPFLVAAKPLHYYVSGVISGKECNHYLVDHAVLLVADTNNTYTVKNSWGSDFGEGGFFRMAQGVNCLMMTTDASVAY